LKARCTGCLSTVVILKTHVVRKRQAGVIDLEEIGYEIVLAIDERRDRLERVREGLLIKFRIHQQERERADLGGAHASVGLAPAFVAIFPTLSGDPHQRASPPQTRAEARACRRCCWNT
jgi:hypothetical protein